MAAPIHPQAMTRMGSPTAVHHEDAGTKYRSTANATGVTTRSASEIVAIVAPTGRRLNVRSTTSRRVLPCPAATCERCLRTALSMPRRGINADQTSPTVIAASRLPNT